MHELMFQAGVKGMIERRELIPCIKLILHFIGTLSCKCRSRCTSQKCPCKKNNSSCGEFYHPGRKCINILQKETSATLSYQMIMSHPMITGYQSKTSNSHTKIRNVKFSRMAE